MSFTVASNPEVELRYAIANLKDEPKCFAAEEIFIDYRTPPSRAEAAELCSGCPVLLLCSEAAQRRRPAWGVWGGRVYGALKKKT